MYAIMFYIEGFILNTSMKSVLKQDGTENVNYGSSPLLIQGRVEAEIELV